jgi:DNA-directed RNA polymerase specialized sigma24 family protein
VALTSNAPPDLLTEFHAAHYTGLVRLAALLLDEPAARDDVVQETGIRAAAAKGDAAATVPQRAGFEPATP